MKTSAGINIDRVNSVGWGIFWRFGYSLGPSVTGAYSNDDLADLSCCLPYFILFWASPIVTILYENELVNHA